MPLVQKPFGDIITFTRASSATMFDSSGTLVYAPMNLLLRSEDFDNAPWTTANSTIAANSLIAPDNTTTADTVTDNATSAQHTVRQSFTAGVNTSYSFSCFLQKGTSNFGYLLIQDGTTAERYFVADFDLDTGVVRASAAGTSGTLTLATITSVGNNWYRCVIVGQLSAGTSLLAAVGVSNGTTAFNTFGAISYSGTGSTIYAWGAQLNQTPMQGGVTGSLSTYYPTTSSAYYGPRLDYDPATLLPRGFLVEEQRTNLLLWSEEFNNAWWTKTRCSITANATTAPTGTAVADKLVEDTSVSASHPLISTPVTLSGTTVHSFSVFAKAAERTAVVLRINAGADGIWGSFNLSTGVVGTAVNSGTGSGATLNIQNVGSGWYRCTLTGIFSSTSTTPSAIIYPAINTADPAGTSIIYTGNGTSGIYIWGAQLEAGAFATSYIPTTTTALTRSADVAAVNTLSPWYNSTEGTLFVEASPQVSNNQAYVIAGINDATALNRITLSKLGTTGNASLSVLISGVTQASTNSGAWTATGKLAGAYKLNDFASSLNGSAAATDTSGTIPTVTQMTLGRRGDGSNILNGHLRRITYYPRRVSNAELQSLTS